MKIRRGLIGLLFLEFAINMLAAAPAQRDSGATGLEERVRRSLIMVPNYTVFDNITFRVDGTKVVLGGQVVRPRLKDDAGKAAGREADIETVENNIEVLPLSPNDERIRADAYRAIYYHPSFTRYAIRAVPPVHIIVKNGNITLEGVVSSAADKNLANMLARGVPGAFSLKNNLVVESRGD